jgi:predicted TIM-barrel fold metal-dependent hydrolase
LRYQDRILFGTDGLDAPSMYRNHFRFLETADECFEDWMYPNHGFFFISGLSLPDDVLRKIYADNALALIPGLASPTTSHS